MKKRLLALLLAIVIIVGLVVVAIPASAASTNETYDVGYAKADISPWIKDYPGATNMVDDAGNAIGIPYNNSWGASYVATNNLVVDTKTGNAVPVAMLNAPIGYSSSTLTMVSDANGDGMNGQGDGIYTTATSVTDKQGNTVLFLTLDAIAGYNIEQRIKTDIVNGVKAIGINLNPDCIYLNGSHTHRGIDPSKIYSSSSAPLKAYWNYYKQKIIDTAVAAYKNATPATMSKGQIDASVASGLQMNFIRHYNTQKTAEDVTGKNVTVIGGPNFGAIGQNATKLSNLYEADDMMYLLQFTPVDTEQKPIVLMNWRAHGTLMTTSDVLSPDYIGSVRSYMEKADYRIAFLQGAAGNAVPNSTVTNATKWKVKNNWNTELRSGFTYTNTDEKTLYLNYYGYLLSRIAQKCVMSELKEGTIRTSSSTYTPDKHKDTAVQIEGALYWHEHSGEITFPWTYTGSNGEECVFDSKNHVSNTYSRNSTKAEQQETKADSMTVNAIMLGNQVAMVTCGNELSDRYTKTDTLQYNTTTKQWYISGTDNDWKDLVDETYGTPFVLAYTNGTHAYMPNYLSYQYNADVPSCGGGCYESQTTPYAPGTGEALVVKLGEMLDSLNSVAPSVNVSGYADLKNAVENTSEDTLIKLTADITLTANLEINENITLDLNGRNITFGNNKIIVAGGKTLSCMDSATADFDVEGDKVNGYSGFTKIPKVSVTGNIAGVPEGANVLANGLQYVKVDDGTNYSFHCLKLDTYAISLQAMDNKTEDPGIYYTSAFAADEILAAKITQYGVALSLLGEPTAENFATKCLATALLEEGKDFQPGADANTGTGTLLYNILNPNNAELVNRVNANKKIYGKAYAIIDGVHYLGNSTDNVADNTEGYSFKDVVELVDRSWQNYDEKEKKGIFEMLRNYGAITKNWELDTILKHDFDKDTVSILSIGNSFSIDSLTLIGEVYKAEGSAKNVEIGIAYYSGCTLQNHVKFLSDATKLYQYHYYDGTSWTVENGLTLTQILNKKDTVWDIVSLQQGCTSSGLKDTYKPYIQQLQSAVETIFGYRPTYLWNMTWAAPKNQTLEDMDYQNVNYYILDRYYSGSQKTMYNNIAAAVKDQVASDPTFRYLVPVGSAIQNANATLVDTDLYRDGRHLRAFGGLIAAYTWYCELEGVTLSDIKMSAIKYDVFSSNFSKGNAVEEGDITLTDSDKALIRDAVNTAITSKFTTTDDFTNEG